MYKTFIFLHIKYFTDVRKKAQKRISISNIVFSTFLFAECPPAMDGMERFACPTPDRQGRYRCIDDHVLCDGFIDCPDGEDEERQACMFYKTVCMIEISMFFFSFVLFFFPYRHLFSSLTNDMLYSK